jgi:hypothetical protein
MKHKEPEEFAPGLWHIWPENWHVPMVVNSDQYRKLKDIRISTWMLIGGDRTIRYLSESGKWISLSNILFSKFKYGKGTLRIKHKDGDRFNWLPENIKIESSYNYVYKKPDDIREEKHEKILSKSLTVISRYHISIKVELLLRYYQNNFRGNMKLEKIDMILTDVYERKRTAQSKIWYLPRFDYIERAAEEIAGHANRKAQIINLLCGGKYGIS